MLFIPGRIPRGTRTIPTGFNLAIEMLFISGPEGLVRTLTKRLMFQSRNRDAFHFRNGRIPDEGDFLVFQSRNRDAFHFRCAAARVRVAMSNSFQSRNRDAFHFRHIGLWHPCARACFNLVIEMLFISGQGVIAHEEDGDRFVSISSSRCFSFQEDAEAAIASALQEFQSRHRDAFHFRRAYRTRLPNKLYVSISSSRCFSFQVSKRQASGKSSNSFNLVIEMLFISGPVQSVGHRHSRSVSISSSRCFSFQETIRKKFVKDGKVDVSISSSRCFSFQVSSECAMPVRFILFQSRHRDAFHFRPKISVSMRRSCLSFQSRHRDAFHFRSSSVGWAPALA